MEKIIYKKSFVSKLILEQDTIPYYQILKDVCATRKKVRTRISFQKETICFGKKKLGALKLSRKNITLYLALDPKDYIDSKYHIKDVSDKKSCKDYPVMLPVKSKRGLKYACELLEVLFNQNEIPLCIAEDIDYQERYYPRSFETLVQEGLIKKYIRTIVDGKVTTQEVLVDKVELLEQPKLVKEEIPAETYQVHFTAKLCYEAQQDTKSLYILSNFTNWNPDLAVKMTRNADDTFTATVAYPKGTNLEFKICRSEKWTDVEKGIWKEEIVNHNYVVVDRDLEVEDLIYNFRK